MNIPGVSAATITSIENSATRTGDAVAISVQKKAMEIQAQSAMELISAAATVQKAVTPSAGTVGANLDVHA